MYIMRGMDLIDFIKRSIEGKTEEHSDNDFFTRYRERLEEILSNSENDKAFFRYLEGSYTYTRSAQVKNQDSYFGSETCILRITAAITFLNGVIAALNGSEKLAQLMCVLPISVTILSVYLTYLQAKNSRKKYHETWIRHSYMFFKLNKECRDFIECMGEYKTFNMDADASDRIKQFKENIFRITDEDYESFLNNIAKLQKS